MQLQRTEGARSPLPPSLLLPTTSSRCESAFTCVPPACGLCAALEANPFGKVHTLMLGTPPAILLPNKGNLSEGPCSMKQQKEDINTAVL